MRLLSLAVLLMLVSTMIFGQSSNKGNRIELNKNWAFSEEGKEKWYPADVPGAVHTDLMANKIIEDPFYRINEKDIQWVGEKNWTYKTSFDVPAKILKSNNIELKFMGLDTYAKVYLNGVQIIDADNMFREWEADCKSLLKEKGNLLEIKFRNVFSENMPKWQNAPYRLMSFDNNDQADIKLNMYSRKAGYHYGWDWGPRLVTYGVWRPVYLEGWNNAKINNVFIKQEIVNKEKADLRNIFEIEADKDIEGELVVFVNGKMQKKEKTELKKGKNKKEILLTINNPRLWWSNGLGEQYLYNFRFEFRSGKNSSGVEYKTGLRSVEVVREKDKQGKSFYVKLNGVPVFAKGANYIPQDNFNHRVTFERYEHIIKSAAEANMNMLRVWGGGIYQENAFYELCDKYGILVWQDMMFACGMYPVNKEYLESIKYEVTDNIKRIRNYCSLALYCGNNENEISWFQWGWKPTYPENIQKQYEQDYRKIFYEIIPEILNEFDGTRFYHPSSPTSDFGQFNYNEGDAHYWSVWHGKEPFEKFQDNIPRFMSEYGFQSYPEMNSIKKFTLPEDRELHSEVMLSHQRCMSDARKDKEYGNRLIQWYMERMYRTPKDFESYLYVAQLLQAEGIKAAVEAHRRAMPYCMGSLYWQIDDCWPVASWSSIDYYGKWKALHYFMVESYKPILVSPVIKKDSIEITVVSDELFSREAVLKLTLCDFSGKLLDEKEKNIIIGANSSEKIYTTALSDLIKTFDKKKVVLKAEIIQKGENLAKNLLFFNEIKDLIIEKPDIKTEIKETDDLIQITFETNKLAKNIFVSCEKTDNNFSDNFFDLMPGEVKTIVLKKDKRNETLKDYIKITCLTDTF